MLERNSQASFIPEFTVANIGHTFYSQHLLIQNKTRRDLMRKKEMGKPKTKAKLILNQKEAINVKTASNNWVKMFFWGIEKESPCTFGQKQVYVFHWLIGPHSLKTIHC